MTTGAFLTYLLTFGFLLWAALYTVRNSRTFAADALAGERMRRVTGVYVPLALLLCGLSLAGVWVSARLSGRTVETVLTAGAPLAMMVLAVMLAPVAAVAVAIQGFTLSERRKRRGDGDAATRLATRGFFVLLTGAAALLVAIFASLLLASG